MLEGLRFFLSAGRRRFMRQQARPGLKRIKARLRQFGSPWAARFLATLADANAEFMAHAVSPDGLLAAQRASLSPESVESCFGSLLIYAANLFAREELARNDGELIALLARTLDVDVRTVMLRRDSLRKTPRSEEWLAYTWLLKDLGAQPPLYDAELERRFAYQYLSYIRQYQPMLEKHLAASH
jgi:hypothetical protein